MILRAFVAMTLAALLFQSCRDPDGSPTSVSMSDGKLLTDAQVSAAQRRAEAGDINAMWALAKHFDAEGNLEQADVYRLQIARTGDCDMIGSVTQEQRYRQGNLSELEELAQRHNCGARR
jgi:hypothetical protein